MTVPTDHHHKRRLPFVGMIRMSRSSSSSSKSNTSGIMVKHHRLQDGNSADDDSSTSSTISTGRNTCSALLMLPLLSEKVPPPPVVTPDAPTTQEAASAATAAPAVPPVAVKKQVRFNEEQNQVHENINSPHIMMFKDECKELWYGPKDYRHFKKSVVGLAREIQLAEQRNTAPCSYQRVMLRTYKACCRKSCNDDYIDEATGSTSGVGVGGGGGVGGVLSDEEERHLIRWMNVSTGRLGVEKLSLRAMSRDRTHRRNEMMELVFEIQGIMTTTTSTSRDDDDVHVHDIIDADDTRAEFIRNTCLPISRPSRLFAMHLATALAKSIHH